MRREIEQQCGLPGPDFALGFDGIWPKSLSGQGLRAKEPQAYSAQYAEDAYAEQNAVLARS